MPISVCTLLGLWRASSFAYTHSVLFGRLAVVCTRQQSGSLEAQLCMYDRGLYTLSQASRVLLLESA